MAAGEAQREDLRCGADRAAAALKASEAEALSARGQCAKLTADLEALGAERAAVQEQVGVCGDSIRNSTRNF